jgi:hypothetical protein
VTIGFGGARQIARPFGGRHFAARIQFDADVLHGRRTLKGQTTQFTDFVAMVAFY